MDNAYTYEAVSLLVPVLINGSETMIWKDLRGLMGIRRMDKVPNAQIRELCGVTRGLTKVFSDASAM